MLAFGLVAAWALLFGINVADTIEDAKEGPEPLDVQVTQALATPAVPLTHLSTAIDLGSVSPDHHHAMVESLETQRLSVASSLPISLVRWPLPRGRPRLFQLFSIYRL